MTQGLGLVQNDDGRIPNEGPCEEDALSLSAGDIGRVHDRLHLHGHGVDLIGQCRALGGIPRQLLVLDDSTEDVLQDASPGDAPLLDDDTHLPADERGIKVAEVTAIEEHLASFGSVEAEELSSDR